MNYEAIIAQKEAEIAGLKHELAELKRLMHIPVILTPYSGDIDPPDNKEVSTTKE